MAEHKAGSLVTRVRLPPGPPILQIAIDALERVWYNKPMDDLLRKCTKCKLEKPDKDYPRRSNGKIYGWCRECKKAIVKAHYRANSAKYKKRAVDRRRLVQLNIQDLKNKPCADCGNKYPYYVMQFDHVSGKKKFNMSVVWKAGYGAEKVRKEAAKCEVVCSNCHAVRSHKRQMAKLKRKQ